MDNDRPPHEPAARGKPNQVADDVRAMIVSGRLSEGDLLGTEAELLERFAVSRPSLREALRILEAEGLISVVRGVLGGVIVHRPDHRMSARTAALLLHSNNVQLVDVVEASAIIEPAAARMVAISRPHRRAARQLAERVAEQWLVVGDTGRFTLAQQRFHEEIIQLAGNQTLVMVQGMLNEVIARATVDVVERSEQQTVIARRRTVRAHELLVSLIDNGDGQGAQNHWAAHMADVRRTLLRGSVNNVIGLSSRR